MIRYVLNLSLENTATWTLVIVSVTAQISFNKAIMGIAKRDPDSLLRSGTVLIERKKSSNLLFWKWEVLFLNMSGHFWHHKVHYMSWKWRSDPRAKNPYDISCNHPGREWMTSGHLTPSHQLTHGLLRRDWLIFIPDNCPGSKHFHMGNSIHLYGLPQ